MNLGTAQVIRANSRHLPLADAGWLAGVIDSEGTVSLIRGAHGNPGLRITVYNSSELILEKVAEILDQLGVKWSAHADTRAPRTGYAVHMATASCMAIYETIRPHMVRHASRYDAAHAFMEPRLERSRRARWTDADRATWEMLREVFNAPRNR
jgi:hypothetical protein